MQPFTRIVHTTTTDPHFLSLVSLLDHELWNELNEDQATYDPLNKLAALPTAVLVYENNEAVACGCFKEVGPQTIEVKRMYVKKEYRGKGYAKKVLTELEARAHSLGYKIAVLETSIHFEVAQTLYKTSGYSVIPNYPPYDVLPDSICLRKCLF